MGIGLIRTLLAVSVVLAHSALVRGYNIADGTTAVQSFYVISGFYMALILNEKYNRPRGVALFASNRFLKLFPVYWLVLLVSMCVSFFCHWRFGPSAGLYAEPWLRDGVRLSLFQKAYLAVVNLALFGQDTTHFVTAGAGGFLVPTANFYVTSPRLSSFLFVPQAWTLGVELLFYCCAPFLVRRSYSSVLSVICLSLLFRIMLIGSGFSNDPWNYRLFPAELALFCGGCLAYKRYRALKEGPPAPSWLPPLVTYSFMAALLLFNYLPGSYAFRQFGLYLLLVVALPYMFTHSKSMRADRFIGELSYPIYISHHLICSVLGQIVGLHGSQFAFYAVGGSIVAAVLLQLAIQEPLEKIRQSRVAPIPAA